MAPDKIGKTIENLRAQDKRDKIIFFMLPIRANTIEIIWAPDKKEGPRHKIEILRAQDKKATKIKALTVPNKVMKI